MKTYNFGIILDERDDCKYNIIGAAFTGIGEWKEPIENFLFKNEIGSCLYFNSEFTGWNGPLSDHDEYCDIIYSLKNDWERIIKEPLMQPFVTKKEVEKKLSPYYYENKVVEPPAGYFILPADIKPDYKLYDKYFTGYEWFQTGQSACTTVKDSLESGQVRAYARPIKGNEELYNRMIISDIAPLHPELKEPFLPVHSKITPPTGYYLLAEDDIIQEFDMGCGIDKGYGWEKIWTKEGFTAKDHYEYFKFYNGPIAYARKAVNTADTSKEEPKTATIPEENYKDSRKFSNMNNTTKLDINKNKIAIRVGTSPTLQKIIIDLYGSKGIGSIKQDQLNKGIQIYSNALCLSINGEYNNLMEYCNLDFYIKNKDCTIFDAATQMGEIVALFEKPSIEVPEVHGYKAEYSKNDGVIRFGCAQISTGLFHNILAIFNKTTVGNRNIASITLTENSKTLNMAQVREILEYVDAVNAE